MKIVYKAGPCSGPCCPNGDTHPAVLVIAGGPRITRQSAKVYNENGDKVIDGGAPVEVPDGIGQALIKDHPAMFEKAGSTPKKAAKTAA
jgi:hypothetical protein